MIKKSQLIILLIIFPLTSLGSVVSQGIVFHRFLKSVESLQELKSNFNSHVPIQKITKTDNKKLIALVDGSELQEEITLIEKFLDEELNIEENSLKGQTNLSSTESEKVKNFVNDEDNFLNEFVKKHRAVSEKLNKDELLMIDFNKNSLMPSKKKQSGPKNFETVSNNEISNNVKLAIKREMAHLKNFDKVNLRSSKNRFNVKKRALLRKEILKNFPTETPNSFINLKLYDAKINEGIKERIFNFEWRPHFNRSLSVGDSGSGSIELKNKTNNQSNYSFGSIFHYGSIISRIGVLFREGYKKLKIPVLNSASFENYLDKNSLKGEGGFLLIKFRKRPLRVNIDTEFEKKIYLNKDFKVEKFFGGHKYTLFIGANPGNTLFTLIDENGKKSEKITYIENSEVTYEEPIIEESNYKKLSLYKKNLLSNRNPEFREDGDKVVLFNRPKSFLRKVGLNLYEFKKPIHEKGTRLYLRFDNLKRSFYLGIGETKSALIPSKGFMQKIIDSFGLEELDKRCLVQLNLNNSPIKFTAEGESTFGPMKLETLYLDKEGEFESESENLNELTDFIFILGDLQGVINIKIDYLNGSSDILRTICSSDDYLVEQL
ncbi:MAG: hypothetical protein VYD54_07700 [Bdellovibrionota bacterium]|nr:hypothetical protein [Bdellovibrionota bacterium]